MGIIYVVINASDNSLATHGFYNYEKAEKAWKSLTTIACNPNAYYIQSIDIY